MRVSCLPCCRYPHRAEALLALRRLVASPERNVANPPLSRAEFLGDMWRRTLQLLLSDFS